MKLRCPYCHATLPEPPPPHCPACRRAFVVPDHLRTRRFRDRRRARNRVQHELEQSLGSHRRLPSWKRSPFQTLALMAGLAVLGAMLVLRAQRTPARKPAVTPVQRAQQELDVLRAALEQFRQHNGRYPSDAEGLLALISNPDLPDWQGPYVTLVRPDPWRTPYRFSFGPNGPVLASDGPDARPGTPDDLAPGDWARLLIRQPGSACR